MPRPKSLTVSVESLKGRDKNVCQEDQNDHDVRLVVGGVSLAILNLGGRLSKCTHLCNTSSEAELSFWDELRRQLVQAF